RLTVSRDRSLEASDPWSPFGDEPWRPNPPVFDGTLTTASAGFGAGYRGMTSDFVGSADVEWAFPSPVGRDWGERTFVQVIGDARWGMLALWNLALDFRGHVQQTFGPDPAPGQRWTMLG